MCRRRRNVPACYTEQDVPFHEKHSIETPRVFCRDSRAVRQAACNTQTRTAAFQHRFWFNMLNFVRRFGDHGYDKNIR